MEQMNKMVAKQANQNSNSKIKIKSKKKIHWREKNKSNRPTDNKKRQIGARVGVQCAVNSC